MKIEGITEETPTSLYIQMAGKGIINEAEDEARQNGIKNVETVQLAGDPAETIIEYAKDHGFDMIVIGSRGLGKVKGFLLGSVSSKVCHAADKTCVTVK
jgi:nucleotide-binding universal stress UspA family protein